jgi:lysyl-tRNA synthetase class I
MSDQTTTTRRTFAVLVQQTVRVTLDPAKFDEAFLAEFRESFYAFHTIEEHAEHLAQMYARGLYDGIIQTFIEGYGEMRDMGIAVEVIAQEQEIVTPARDSR